MPRVLVVQPSCPAYRRGFFESIARELDLQLVCSESSPDGAVSDIDGIACPVTVVDTVHYGRHVMWQRAVVARVLRRPPSVLVVNGNPRYLSTLLAVAIARARGIKVVWWGHAMSSTSRPLRAWFRKRLMKLAHRIFLYYPEEVDSLPPDLHSRAVGLDNSVDTERSLAVSDAVSAAQVDEFRAGLGLGSDKLVLTIGRLTDKANVALLLEALAAARSTRADVRLAILGDGSESDRLRAKASELGVADSVFFVGSLFDEIQIGLWMRSASVFAYGGAVGLSLIHGFSYALPAVIAWPMRGHMPEALLFREGQYGVSFESGDAASLSEALLAMLADEERAMSMGLAAQEMVRERLGVEKMAANFLRGLEGLDQ